MPRNDPKMIYGHQPQRQQPQQTLQPPQQSLQPQQLPLQQQHPAQYIARPGSRLLSPQQPTYMNIHR